MPAAANPAPPVAQAVQSPDRVLAALCRELATDGRLLARAPASEVDRRAEAALRSLWADSRVKLFVGVLAAREVRRSLLAEAVRAAGEPPLGAGEQPAPGDDGAVG